MNVKQHRAGSIGVIGHMYRAFCQIPNQPCIHRAKKQPAFLCLLSCALHIFQYPCNFGSTEIGVRHQSRLFFHAFSQACRRHFIYHIRSPPTLPDNRIVYGRSRLLVPYNRSFTLIGNANAADILRLCAHHRHRFNGNCKLRGPYLHRIMLHPPRIRINLLKLSLRHRTDFSLFVKQNAAGTCRPLIQCQYILFHYNPPCRSVPSSVNLTSEPPSIRTTFSSTLIHAAAAEGLYTKFPAAPNCNSLHTFI